MENKLEKYGQQHLLRFENQLSKGSAADGRTERKETGSQGQGAKVQVPLGLGHPSEKD